METHYFWAFFIIALLAGASIAFAATSAKTTGAYTLPWQVAVKCGDYICSSGEESTCPSDCAVGHPTSTILVGAATPPTSLTDVIKDQSAAFYWYYSDCNTKQTKIPAADRAAYCIGYANARLQNVFTYSKLDLECKEHIEKCTDVNCVSSVADICGIPPPSATITSVGGWIKHAIDWLTGSAKEQEVGWSER